MHKFYSKHKFPFFLIPSLFAPLFPFPFFVFPVAISLLLFLSTFWSLKMQIYLTLKSNTKNPTFIFYKNKYLCKIKIKNSIKYFISKKKIYIIEADIIKLSPRTNLNFQSYRDYENLEYTPSKYKCLMQKNDFNYVPPSFISLFCQHAIAPLFVFQIFSSLLWCLDEYPYYALITVVMQIIFEAGVVFTRLKNLKEFGTLNLKTSDVSLVYRKNETDLKNINTKELLPGDVIYLQKPGIQIPCDLLILEGSSAVNEAMLTGESIPLMKEEIKEDEILDLEKHKKYILFGGTELIKINEKLKCFVLKTGFETNQGKLIKKMMDTDESILNKEAFYFIGCLLVFAIIASVYVIKAGIENGKNSYKIMVEVIIILTNVVPPELPMEMTIAISSALQNLLMKNIFCLEGSRVPICGKVDVCCFDKTGTLTEIEMDVVKMIGYDEDKIFILNENLEISSYVDNEDFNDDNKIDKEINNNYKEINNKYKETNINNKEINNNNKETNRYMNDNEINNNNKTSDNINERSSISNNRNKEIKKNSSVESIDTKNVKESKNLVSKKTLKNKIKIEPKTEKLISTIATCHSLIKMEKCIGDPVETSAFRFLKIDLIDENTSKENNNLFKVLKRYSFCSELRRMTVVAEKESQVFVSVKGAPEVIEKLLVDIPKEYQIYKKYTIEGYRVIALASKKYKRKIDYNREDVEKELNFVGFVLYECKIKKDTKESIEMLKESGHKIVMITGDNLMTAVNVAKKVGIIENKNFEDNQNKEHFYGKIGVEGDEIENVLESKDFFDYKIFARADPKHKERIIKKYKDNGKITLMCGDGTNDVGALKMSDVGVALVEGKTKKIGKFEEAKVKLGDASVAAPFTAKTGSINAVLDIIRQGRSTLVTTIQMYKILALNSLISAYSLSILDCIGVRYGDVQMTISGVLIAFAFMFLTKSKTLKEISKKRPVDNIFNKYVVCSIVLQTLIHILSFTVILRTGICENVVLYENEGFGMKSGFMNEFYKDHEIKIFEKKEGEQVAENTFENKFKPSILNSAIFLLSVSQQINTFILNYIGRPFRESFLENSYLRNSLMAVSAIVIGLVLEVNEGFSRLMEIVPLNGYKWTLFGIIVFDFVFCLIAEKICFALFML